MRHVLAHGETVKNLYVLPHGASVSVKLAAAVQKAGKGLNLTWASTRGQRLVGQQTNQSGLLFSKVLAIFREAS